MRPQLPPTGTDAGRQPGTAKSSVRGVLHGKSIISLHCRRTPGLVASRPRSVARTVIRNDIPAEPSGLRDARGSLDVMDLCGIGKDQAKRLLRKLMQEQVLVAEGNLRWRKYGPGPRLKRSEG